MLCKHSELADCQTLKALKISPHKHAGLGVLHMNGDLAMHTVAKERSAMEGLRHRLHSMPWLPQRMQLMSHDSGLPAHGLRDNTAHGMA